MNKFAVLLSLLIIIFFGNSFSQSNYLVNIENVNRVDDFTYKFDVYIESTNNNFELTSYQCAFQYETNDISNDNFTFSFIDGSSGLNNKPTFGITSTVSDGHYELTFASNAGSDIIGSNKIKIGTFMLKRQKRFESFAVDWNFSGTNSTILTGKNFNDITYRNNFTSPYTITGIEYNSAQVISDYQLFQNYPNPFNPSTIIRWQMPEAGNVTLKIYDILGNEITTLLNKKYSAGVYEVKFDGSSLASGVYLYMLKVGNIVQTKKMILTK